MTCGCGLQRIPLHCGCAPSGSGGLAAGRWGSSASAGLALPFVCEIHRGPERPFDASERGWAARRVGRRWVGTLSTHTGPLPSADRPAGRCWVDEHATLGPVGVALMLVYLLGYPLLTFFRVLRVLTVGYSE